MDSRYVIKTKLGYIKWADITMIERFVEIRRVGYTENLQAAKVWNENDYKEDIDAWERYYESKEGDHFNYESIEIVMKTL